ncbi:hypothetical protein [Pandoraea sp. ISTKB]|uniref:hypothetical protein n=1 Tax=Pandoraea sp. ISTKB TaxID=1586708 RepID=UPI00147AD15B|nr:hypothetical protein [Pandoraea sp. ISTKB]
MAAHGELQTSVFAAAGVCADALADMHSTDPAHNAVTVIQRENTRFTKGLLGKIKIDYLGKNNFFPEDGKSSLGVRIHTS